MSDHALTDDELKRFGLAMGRLTREPVPNVVDGLDENGDRQTLTLTTFTLEQVHAMLQNVGVDTTCGACMSIAHTGFGGYAHTCEAALEDLRYGNGMSQVSVGPPENAPKPTFDAVVIAPGRAVLVPLTVPVPQRQAWARGYAKAKADLRRYEVDLPRTADEVGEVVAYDRPRSGEGERAHRRERMAMPGTFDHNGGREGR